MSFTIVKGYILNKINFNLFDEIIIFLAETGNIFTCIAKGTKKISSKNARNLIYFQKIEFEFFSSRFPNKMGKLMRAKIYSQNNLSSIKNIVVENMSLFFINELLLKTKLTGLFLYKFYEWTINQSKKGMDNYILIINSLIFFIKFLGYKINLDKCSSCQKKINICCFSYEYYGFLCIKCSKDNCRTNINIIEILYCIHLQMYDKASLKENKYKEMTIKLLIDFYNKKLFINLFTLLKII